MGPHWAPGQSLSGIWGSRPYIFPEISQKTGNPGGTPGNPKNAKKVGVFQHKSGGVFLGFSGFVTLRICNFEVSGALHGISGIMGGPHPPKKQDSPLYTGFFVEEKGGKSALFASFSVILATFSGILTTFSRISGF